MRVFFIHQTLSLLTPRPLHPAPWRRFRYIIVLGALDFSFLLCCYAHWGKTWSCRMSFSFVCEKEGVCVQQCVCRIIVHHFVLCSQTSRIGYAKHDWSPRLVPSVRPLPQLNLSLVKGKYCALLTLFELFWTLTLEEAAELHKRLLFAKRVWSRMVGWVRSRSNDFILVRRVSVSET